MLSSLKEAQDVKDLLEAYADEAELPSLPRTEKRVIEKILSIVSNYNNYKMYAKLVQNDLEPAEIARPRSKNGKAVSHRQAVHQVVHKSKQKDSKTKSKKPNKLSRDESRMRHEIVIDSLNEANRKSSTVTPAEIHARIKAVIPSYDVKKKQSWLNGKLKTMCEKGLASRVSPGHYVGLKV